MSAELFPCFGIQALEGCAYNPGAAPVYFGLGDAIAALGFTLTVQQLLKPIYRFRLRARYLSVGKLYAIVFAGAASAVIAALVPNIPALATSPLGYALFWELLGAGLFSLAYGALTWAILFPVKVSPKRIEQFAQATASLLASAEDRDRADFATDLEASLPTLINSSNFISWRREEFSAFYEFTHRHKIRQSEYAWSLLRILSDPLLCRVLVTQTPWVTARFMREISRQRLHSRAAEQFIRQVGAQAILAKDSMLVRESGYHGFGSAPLMTESIFADSFILHHYDPFDSFKLSTLLEMEDGAIERFGQAAERAMTCLVENKMFWHEQALISIESFYKTASMKLWTDRKKITENDRGHVRGVMTGVRIAIEAAQKAMLSMSPETLSLFYSDENHTYQANFIEQCANIIFEALSYASNDFNSYNDAYWLLAHDTFRKVFPSVGEEPDGMDPLQQRVAIKLIEKLEDNMRGYYPSISRILISCIGPYSHKAAQRNKTAFNILKDATYGELKDLKTLHEKNGEKFNDFLPDAATYDPAANTLTYRYRSGEGIVTRLNRLKTPWSSLNTADVRRAGFPVPELDG